MIPQTLAAIELDLKKASAQQQYALIECLALTFGDAARSEIATLAPGDPAVAEIAEHVLGVLEWSRLITLAGRAMTADELRGIPFLNRYLAGSPARPPMVRMDA